MGARIDAGGQVGGSCDKVRDDGDLVQEGSGKDGEKRSDSGYI